MQTKKSKLIGLLLLIVSATFGQQVPNTTTFKLDTVIDVVGPTTNDLLDCFSDANPDYFNDTYNDDAYAPANSLLRFRDYGAHNAATIVAPTVITNAATSVTEVNAVLNGEVTSDGGATITERGFRVSSSSDMSSPGTRTVSGTTGTFSYEYMIECTNETRYFQAYATNSAGTTYGDVLSFTTTSPTLLSFSIYDQIQGVTISSSATALAACNAAYLGQFGTSNYYTRYASTMTGTGQYVLSTGTHSACTWIGSTPGSTFWYVAVSGTDVWAIEIDHTSKVITSTVYVPTVTNYTTSGTWTKPSGVTHIKVEAWGGGGTGGAATGTGARGAGGCGGTYVSKIIAVPNASYAYVVGASTGGSTTLVRNGKNTTFGSTLVIATGGIGGAINTTTGGAAATTSSTTGSVGDVIYAGGDGGAGTSGGYSGGGGGGAGSTGAGGNASNNTAGTGTSQNGGNGGAGRNTAGAGATGLTYGGGGAGGCATTSTDMAGGTGAAGYMRITY